MKKSGVIIAAILIALLLLSCSQQDDKDETIRIWMYRYKDNHGDNELKNLMESRILYYAEENNIETEVIVYTDDEMTEEDYMLKRNLALEHGDADIIIGDMRSGMHQIEKYAADYTKLSNYDNVFDNFKGHHFVPLTSRMTTIILDKQVLETYGIESDKYITINEYYEIKQKLKAAGARFKYDAEEHIQLLYYYINKNNLKMINENGQFTINRQVSMKTIQEIAEDITENYKFDIYTINKEIERNINYDRIIYDEILGRPFSQRGQYQPLKFLSFTYDITPPFEDYVVVIENDLENTMLRVPCMIINKNSSKESTYEIADYLLSDKFQSSVYNNNTLTYSTITDTPDVRRDTGYNDDRSYKYEPGKTKIYNTNLTGKDIKELIPVVQKAYDIFNNTDTEKFFTPFEYRIAIQAFIGNEALKIVENPNYSEEDFNRSVDEYLTSFNVLYN